MGGGTLLDEILQGIGDYGLPEKSLQIETQSYIDNKEIHSVPDGLISCNYAFNIYIESKLSEDIKPKQLENHKKLLDEDRDDRNKLIYITTHTSRPEILPQDILWTNWTTLMDLLNSYKQEDSNPYLSHRTIRDTHHISRPIRRQQQSCHHCRWKMGRACSLGIWILCLPRRSKFQKSQVSCILLQPKNQVFV